MPDLQRTAERAVAAAGGSKFTLVGAIVARAAQLGAGWPPVVTGVEVDKFATTALREIAAGAVEVGHHVQKVQIVHDEEAA